MSQEADWHGGINASSATLNYFSFDFIIYDVILGNSCKLGFAG
jgi:hypothetical protein